MHNPLVRRLEKVERRKAQEQGPFPGPYTRIITESDEDRDRQLAALAEAGRYVPGVGTIIDRRIVDPKPRFVQ